MGTAIEDVTVPKPSPFEPPKTAQRAGARAGAGLPPVIPPHFMGLVCLLLFIGCTQDQQPTELMLDGAGPDPMDMGMVVDMASDAAPPPVGFATAEYCGNCHVEHYRQWSGSMHAYATKDPVFIAMVEKGIADTEGRLDQFCVQCHAPVASRKGQLPVIEGDGTHTMDLDLTNPLIADGVQCVTCHSIERVNGTQNADFDLSEVSYFGPTGSEAANIPHPVAKSPLFNDPAQKSLLCGSCHDVLNPNGARLEATFSEWYSNDFNAPQDPEQHKTCGDCHMPTYQGPITENGPIKTLHSHRFIGVDQALIADFPQKEEQARLIQDLLAEAAHLEVRYNGINKDGDAVVVVAVENVNNGHNLPSGSTADRQVWAHVRITDETGTLVYESGALDENGDLADGVEGHSRNPEADPELLLFGQFIYGADGEHVLFPWEAHQYTDNLLGPGQRKWRDFLIPVDRFQGDSLTVEAVLKYRTFPPFLIARLIELGHLPPDVLAPIPIIEMNRVRETFRLRP